MGRSGLIILVAVLVALFGFARHSSDSPASTSGQDPPAFGGSGSVTAHLKVVPTIRSVTVSPGSVNFGNCNEGTGDTASAGDQMGYPNGICLGGQHRLRRALPGHGHLHRPGRQRLGQRLGRGPRQRRRQLEPVRSDRQARLHRRQNQPGNNQFTIMTFAQDVAYYQMLTGDAKCDTEFAGRRRVHGGASRVPERDGARGHPADRADGLGR